MDRKEELRKALEKGKLYTFIADNGMQFEKDELIDIIRNLTYCIRERVGLAQENFILIKTMYELEEEGFFEEVE